MAQLLSSVIESASARDEQERRAEMLKEIAQKIVERVATNIVNAQSPYVSLGPSALEPFGGYMSQGANVGSARIMLVCVSTQFACFTSTKVQILTLKALLRYSRISSCMQSICRWQVRTQRVALVRR